MTGKLYVASDCVNTSDGISSQMTSKSQVMSNNLKYDLAAPRHIHRAPASCHHGITGFIEACDCVHDGM